MGLLERIDVLLIGEQEETAYQKFFKKKLAEFDVSSPEELEGDEKKRFFDEVDKEWKGKEEKD
jgi:hypothetical protein